MPQLDTVVCKGLGLPLEIAPKAAYCLPLKPSYNRVFCTVSLRVGAR